MRIVYLLVLFQFASILLAGPRIHHTGGEEDVSPQTHGGLLLLGGGGDVDEAMRWFLRQAGGGDIVVLRASGSDGYNHYLHSELGVAVHSVRSVVFRNRGEASDPEVLELLARAEGIFIAGGDQSRYIRYWGDTAVAEALEQHVRAGRPLGGTSAGLAILGEYSYAALHDGDLTSRLALEQPDHRYFTVEHRFLDIPLLRGILTDTHFSERKRLGRLLVLLAHAQREAGQQAVIGLGVDEATALCVGPSGKGRVLASGQGRVHVVVPAELPAAFPLSSPFGPAAVRVLELGPESEFDLVERDIRNPAAQYTVQVAEGEPVRLVEEPKGSGGTLVMAGGGLRDSNDSVLGAFIRKGKLDTTGTLCILPAASTRPVRSAMEFVRSMVDRGVARERIRILPLAVKDDPGTAEVDESQWAGHGDHAAVAEAIAGSTAVWMTGGDQARIMRVLRKEDGTATAALEALRTHLESGGVLGGTSAGAAVHSEVMILGGSSLGALRHGQGAGYESMEDQEGGPLLLGEGLGVFPHGIIDQHFDRKGRLGRLIVALLETGEEDGFGIDEDTALIYDRSSGSATVAGPGTVVHVNVAEAEVVDGAMRGVRLSVYNAGDRLQWPGPTLSVGEGMQTVLENPYFTLPDPAAGSILHPYGGHIGDILGYLLLDNGSADTLRMPVVYPDGKRRILTLRTDERTQGWWGTPDGQMDQYTIRAAILDVGPEGG